MEKKEEIKEEINQVSEEEVKSFLAEYTELARKHQIDIAPYLDISANGILPKLIPVRLKNENNKSS